MGKPTPMSWWTMTSLRLPPQAWCTPVRVGSLTALFLASPWFLASPCVALAQQAVPLTRALPLAPTATAPATGDSTVPATGVSTVPATGVSTVPATGVAGAAPAPGSGPAPDEQSQQRIGKLQALSFDRQPAVVLLGVPADKLDEALGAATAARRARQPADSSPPATGPATPDPFDRQLESLAGDVAAGRWEAVGLFLRSLPEAEAKAGYDRILDQFTTLPTPEPGPTGQPTEPTLPAIMIDDVTGLIRAAPLPLAADDGKRVESLGRIGAIILQTGAEAGDLLAAVTALTDGPAPPLSRRQGAALMAQAGRADLIAPLLPPLPDCVRDRDADGVDLWVRSLQAARARDPQAVTLETLWDAVQFGLDVEGIDADQRRRAVGRAATLLPRLPRATAREWIAGVTSTRPAAAADLLAFVAAQVVTGPTRSPREIDPRKEWLALQRAVVDGVLAGSGADGARWRGPLAIAARGWSAEARLAASLDDNDSGFRRDPYGNMYYWEQQEIEQRRQMMPQWPVKLADVLDAAPTPEWLARIDPAERPGIEKALVAALGKAGRTDAALSALERLATDHHDAARGLVPGLLDAWKLDHDPNDERRRRMPFFWYFGMDEQLTGIPLSRSLQERNLGELAAFTARLRALDLGPLDELKLVECFTTSHSVAEVYRPESIARVFGPAEQVAPRTAAALAEKMRTNLAGTWRKPSVQEQAKTKRREADIKAEVLAGYGTARDFVAGARARDDHWSLQTAAAALAHDENDFRRTLADSPEFTPRRREALDSFAAAAAAYAAATATLPRDQWTTAPFETWLLAASGACDADRIDETTQAVEGEPERIRAAVDRLAAEPRQWHAERLATGIVSRLSKLGPAVKHRVTRAGLVVAGDHPQAREARQVIDYYGDLVREIELRAEIDGPDRVGHGRPFGVLVSLRHTREIEREAGGFGRYLQNQKASSMFAFNFGRPLQDYRDVFEQTVRRTLGESFEVKSVTFESEKVASRADAEYGWRRTPYAYLLLAAKDPKIDRLPPLRLDLDFLDTAGYVVLPIESRPTMLDARDAPPPARPWERLALTQILDDRRAAEGALALEVRATARGLVPDLEAILDPRVAGFTVTGINDTGVVVSRFDPDTTAATVVTERTWTVALERGADAAGTFVFPTPRVETAELLRQRYADADLVAAAETIDLRGPVDQASGSLRRLIIPAVGALGAVGALAIGWRLWRSRRRPRPRGFTVPDPATPFAVLELLRDIQSTNGLDRRAHAELAESIDRIEHEFFAAGGTAADSDLAAVARTDLAAVARNWASRMASRPARVVTAGDMVETNWETIRDTSCGMDTSR
jgi:hypothetical protein